MRPGNVEIIDSEDIRVSKSGTGWTASVDSYAAGLTHLLSNATGDYVELEFYGSAVWLRFLAGVDRGQASISVDGGAAKALDMYDEASSRPRMSWLSVNLSPGVKHKVRVTVAGTKNASSTGYYVSVDCFIVELTAGALQIWAMVEDGSILVKPTPVTVNVPSIGTVDDRGVYLATPPSLSDGSKQQLTLTSDGRLRTEAKVG